MTNSEVAKSMETLSDNYEEMSIQTGFQSKEESEKSNGINSVVNEPPKKGTIPQYIPPHLREDKQQTAGDDCPQDGNGTESEPELRFNNMERRRQFRHDCRFQPKNRYVVPQRRWAGFRGQFQPRVNTGYRNPVPQVNHKTNNKH